MASDISFKKLVSLDLSGVLPSLVPDTARILGLPDEARLLSAEVLPLAAARHSRLMDIAIRYGWSSGHTAIILQVEHWSRSRDLDLRRSARYTTDLLVRHPTDTVLPVMVLCDHPATPLPERLIITAGGLSVLDFRALIVEVQRDVLPRWYQHQTRMLAVLAAMVDDLAPEQRAMRSLRFALTFGADFAAAALPFIEDFATIASDEELRHRFHDQLREDRNMASVIDLFRAEGKAEGKAEGTVSLIRGLVADGLLSVDQARTRINILSAEGTISPQQADSAIRQLG